MLFDGVYHTTALAEMQEMYITICIHSQKRIIAGDGIQQVIRRMGP